MIGRLRGKVLKKSKDKLFIDVSGICYEVYIPKTVGARLDNHLNGELSLVIYHYLHMDKNRYIPVLIGFMDELEKDFFEIFISVSGIGPKAAVKALDRPVSLVAKAIEEGDVGFLKGLAGIGVQKAKQIVAQLQGKVGRFALLKAEDEEKPQKEMNKEIVEQARQVLKRLQYSYKEIDSMIKKAFTTSSTIDSVESLLNEIYRKMH